MKECIVVIAVALGLIVLGAFIRDVNAATSNTLTMYLDNTTINSQGTNIPSCRVQKDGAELVIPAPCDEVAAEIRARICGNSRADADNKFECRLQPFTTFDFVIDGVHTGVI